MAPKAAEGVEPQEQTPSSSGQPMHRWWVVSNRGEHGRNCGECRRAPGGPDAGAD